MGSVVRGAAREGLGLAEEKVATIYIRNTVVAPSTEVTILLHDGDKCGEFEPWMVKFLLAEAELVAPSSITGSAEFSESGFRKIATALESLWKEEQPHED